ncbi:MAG: HPF/RaiA family ribosome-associated protein [Candidatus Aenigmatarchaeota archaeon]|nr:HPF/RaiA family ribosome-associated protein [Candidatus Aenigmarchaeota archaeon]
MNVQLSGFDNLTLEIKDMIREKSEKLLEKYKKMFGEKSVKIFKLSADKIRERGDHKYYQIKCYLETTHGLFYADHSDWKVLDAVEKVLNEIEKQIVKKKDTVKRT